MNEEKPTQPENNNQPTPEAQPLGAEQIPQSVPQAPPQTSMQKHKWILYVAFGFLGVCFIAGFIWGFMNAASEDANNSSDQTSEASDADDTSLTEGQDQVEDAESGDSNDINNETEQTELKTDDMIQFSYGEPYMLTPHDGEVRIYGIDNDAENEQSTTEYASLQIPDDYKVYSRESTGYPDWAGVIVESPEGYFIQMSQIDGLGGDCGDNEDSYTLTKKLSTNNPNMSFTQYTAGDDYASQLDMEPFFAPSDGVYFRTNGEQHDGLEEGESNTNTCNLFNYPTVANSTLMQLYNDPFAPFDSDDSSLTWEEIMDSPEFIAVLQSFDTTWDGSF